MGPKDVIKQTLDMSDFIVDKYLADLSDQDIRLRPIDGMHSIALQLGHLIAGERMFTELVKPGSSPPLPDGFKEAHDIKNKELSDAGFLSKDKYVELLKAQRAATLAVLDEVPDSRFSRRRPKSGFRGLGGNLPRSSLRPGSRRLWHLPRRLVELEKQMMHGIGC